MNTIRTHSSETRSSFSALADALNKVCATLMEVLDESIDIVKSYGEKSLQGLARGVQGLTVDTILGYLKQIDVLMKEISQHTDHSWSQLLQEQQQSLLQKFAHHPFFQENFGWRVQEIVYS